MTNLLLDMLPQDYRASLLARMEPVSLPLHTVLYKPEEVPRYAHFVTSGIASVVTFMSNGSGAEVGLIGREGGVECFHLLGPANVTNDGFIQMTGSALRMPFADLEREFNGYPPLRRLVLQFVQGQGLLLGQIAACNRLHEVEERLSRWLLMVQDRVQDDQLTLTQEFLAEMLGARRTTVTLVAGALQRGGLIEYRRGNVRILNRPGLEAAACECYGVSRKVLQNLYK